MATAQAQAAPPFELSTQIKYIPLQSFQRPTGGGVQQVELQKVGILSQIYIPITFNITSAGLSNLNPLGMASVIKRVSLQINGGHFIANFSGSDFHWLLRDFLNEGTDAYSYTDARSAVATGAKTLDLVIPVSQNIRDAAGLIMLQNGVTVVNLQIEWEADSVIATGITSIAATASPIMAVFDVPQNQASWPALNTLHQVLSEQVIISGAVTYDYKVQTGAIITGLYNLFTPGWTSAQLILQQANVLNTETPEQHQARVSGVMGRPVTLTGGAITGYNKRILYDRPSEDGMGQYGSFRDMIDSRDLTDIVIRAALSGAGTWYHLRRQILPLQVNG